MPHELFLIIKNYEHQCDNKALPDPYLDSSCTLFTTAGELPHGELPHEDYTQYIEGAKCEKVKVRPSFTSSCCILRPNIFMATNKC